MSRTVAPRRRLLAGGGFASVLAAFALPAAAQATPQFTPAMSPHHPDAELIGACMAFMAANQAVTLKLSEPCDSIDWNPDAELRAEDEAFEPVCRIRAKTLVGAKAKARVIVAMCERDILQRPDDTVEDAADPLELAAWRLAHDVLLLGAA